MFAPVPAAPAPPFSHGAATAAVVVKTWLGIAEASVKTINGLANASVKTVNGRAMP